ncbi:hypothetical protein [Arcobacter arenosus]|uniref:Uncharacterized protein n=1 Tax=Arcobacter arenosus TaxID=2576037 RepID=A0A5R8XZ48_9BACT|nr:hypothetical protein [Arcobacter arenosus]TLP36945.1 hypothetical protein FDK22_11925 [Arcobacter arenosus]
MKLLLILTVFTNILLANVITCKNKNTASSIYLLSQLQNSILTNQGELDGNLVFGDIDPANSPIAYYDDSSAVCGGSGNYNRIVEAYCNHNIDACWSIRLGESGVSTIIQKESTYTNNVILVNGLPCLPYGVNNVTVGFYDYDNNDIGLANFLLTNIEDENTIALTESEARSQREYCPNLLKYIDEWELKLDLQNESLNKSLTTINILNTSSINQRLEDINITLQNLNTTNQESEDYTGVADSLEVNPDINSELDSFTDNIKSSIENSFDNYSNVFGFGGYGSAPTPITFSMFGKTYSAFDVSNYSEHLSLIRTTFLSFAYVWGFILVVRDLA